MNPLRVFVGLCVVAAVCTLGVHAQERGTPKGRSGAKAEPAMPAKENPAQVAKEMRLLRARP